MSLFPDTVIVMKLEMLQFLESSLNLLRLGPLAAVLALDLFFFFFFLTTPVRLLGLIRRGHIIIHQGFFSPSEGTELVMLLFMQISSHSASLEGK